MQYAQWSLINYHNIVKYQMKEKTLKNYLKYNSFKKIAETKHINFSSKHT